MNIKYDTKITPLEKQVIRKVRYCNICYLAIMDESIANRGNGRNIEDTNGRYTLLCSHINGNDIEIDVKHCELNENVKIYKEDMFSLPTVDEYIKLGMVLRCSHIRFSKKTNKLLITEDLPFSIL